MAKKWNKKNSWQNKRTATGASIGRANTYESATRSESFGGKSKGTGGGRGGMDALTAFQNILTAHGGVQRIVDETDPCSYYDDDFLEGLAEIALGIVGIPWKNGIYDKDLDEVDFEEEVEAYIEFVLPTDIAMQWLSGELWIPEEVLDWAFYEVSDHNKK